MNELTARENEISRKMGLDPERYQAAKTPRRQAPTVTETTTIARRMVSQMDASDPRRVGVVVWADKADALEAARVEHARSVKVAGLRFDRQLAWLANNADRVSELDNEIGQLEGDK